MKHQNSFATATLMASLLGGIFDLNGQGMNPGQGGGPIGGPGQGGQRPGGIPVQIDNPIPVPVSLPAPTPEENPTDTLTEFLERYDLNGDGSVSLTEAQAVLNGTANLALAFIEERDLNGDGAVAFDELVFSGIEAAAAAQSEFLAEYDLDGDGTISSGESLTVHSNQVEERIGNLLDQILGVAPGGFPFNRFTGVNAGRPTRPGLVSNAGIPGLDANRDGSITESEVIAISVELIGTLQDTFNERFDQNADGHITPDEMGSVNIDAIVEQAVETLERLDENLDGLITIEEVTFDTESAPQVGTLRPGRGQGDRPAVNQQPNRRQPREEIRRPRNNPNRNTGRGRNNSRGRDSDRGRDNDRSRDNDRGRDNSQVEDVRPNMNQGRNPGNNPTPAPAPEATPQTPPVPSIADSDPAANDRLQRPTQRRPRRQNPQG